MVLERPPDRDDKQTEVEFPSVTSTIMIRTPLVDTRTVLHPTEYYILEYIFDIV